MRKYVLLMLLIEFCFNSLIAQKYSGELVLRDIPVGHKVTLQSYAVWGTDWENYPYLNPETWDSLYYIEEEVTVSKTIIYLEFHGDSDGGEYGDGPPGNRIYGYALYRLSVEDYDGYVFLDYRDADYFGENYNEYYTDGDVKLFFKGNYGWETDLGNEISNYSRWTIWNERKEKGVPPNNSLFKFPTPFDIDITWYDSHPKLTWDMNWGIDNMLELFELAFPHPIYIIERKSCTGFKYLDCTDFLFVSSEEIPRIGVFNFIWVDEEVNNSTTDYQLTYRIKVTDSEKFIQSSDYSLPVSCQGEFIPFSREKKIKVESFSPVIDMSIYPNPFNNSININIANHEKPINSIDIYNLNGQHIKSLSINRSSNSHKIVWSADDSFGNKVKSGIYFIVTKSKSEIINTNKILYIK